MNGVQPVMTWWRRWWSDEDQKSKRRPRIVLAIVVALCVTVTGIAVTGAGNAPPGLKFTQAGHWVYNSVLGTAFHVDGGSKAIDAEVSIPGLGPGSTIVQTDGEGYVLSREQTVEFGKSDLAVTDRVEPKASEAAVGLEAAGAAYAIYPKAGNIVRFGDQPATLELNQPLGSSVVTRTGTLWVHQLGGGQLCQLPLKATRLTCTASTRTGHKGGLAMVGDRPVFVDTTANTMTPVSGDGLGRTTRLDIDLPDTAVIAANDLGGRIAVLNPDTPSVHLVDAAAALDGEVVEPTTSTPLEPGRYERVASAGKALVLIEENTGTVVTVDEGGKVHESEKLPEPSKAAKTGKNKQAKAGMFRGDDGRVYVDSAAGEHVMVVEDDGEITPVEVTGDGEEKRPTPTTTPTTTPTSTPTPTWTPAPQKRDTPKPKPRDPEPEPTREPEPEPEPEPKKTPDPVPASRPGAPSNVRGAAGDARITVTWGTARNNGSPITAYELSWSGGSKTVAPSARKTTITGLRNGTSYTVTVRAVNRIGDGPGVRTNAVTPAASPKIKVSRGSDTDQYCDPPDCAWMHVVMTGFAPNTQYHLQPHSSNSGYSNGGADLTTDANGRIDTERFAYESVGSTVWVTVATPNGTVTSNKLKWPGWSGGPQLVVSRGEDSSSDSCEEPDCAWLHVVMNGFEPNTEYTVTGWASEWEDFSEPSVVTTDDEGHLVFEDIRFDGGGQDVWVFTDTPDGRVESNHYYWEPQ